MQKHFLLSVSVWKMRLQRKRYARLAILALLVGLLALPGAGSGLAPSCRPGDDVSCVARSGFRPYSGAARLPEGSAPASRGSPAKSPHQITHLPPNITNFINLALPYALQAHKALGWQTSVILAQWGLEQGWHVPSYTGYNWGNVGPMPGVPTVPGTSTPGSPVAFSYARTPADGAQVYIMAARLPYYDRVFLAAPHGPIATAVALGCSPWDANHYTNTGQPGSSLIDMMQRYNLMLFDRLLA